MDTRHVTLIAALTFVCALSTTAEAGAQPAPERSLGVSFGPALMAHRDYLPPDDTKELGGDFDVRLSERRLSPLCASRWPCAHGIRIEAALPRPRAHDAQGRTHQAYVARLEAQFMQRSYGYRPGPSTYLAVGGGLTRFFLPGLEVGHTTSLSIGGTWGFEIPLSLRDPNATWNAFLELRGGLTRSGPTAPHSIAAATPGVRAALVFGARRRLGR